jgi:hypothetical protein
MSEGGDFRVEPVEVFDSTSSGTHVSGHRGHFFREVSGWWFDKWWFDKWWWTLSS